MKLISSGWALVFGVAVVLLGACSKKTDVKADLEKTADLLAQTDAAQPTSQATPAPPPTAALETSIPEQPAQPAAVPVATPSQQMRQALAAYKTGELEDAVTRLQKLRATPTLTAQQRMAVQDSVAAVMTEIYELAAKGNDRALRAVKQYEQMQTSRQ